MPAVMQIIEHTNRDCQEGKLAGREVVYSAVAARRQQWDNLVWQVPVLSLTAQAFLFTIAIGGDSQRIARVIASLLSLVVTFLCMTLMARHRQAEIMDAHWLEDFEKAEWPSDAPVHGIRFRHRGMQRVLTAGGLRPWCRHSRDTRRGSRDYICSLSPPRRCWPLRSSHPICFRVSIPGEQLAEAAGLSVPRVYQIRDGRR